VKVRCTSCFAIAQSPFLKAEGSQASTAPQRSFLSLFTLFSLPCISKAASFAPKIEQKLLTEGCYAVSNNMLFQDKENYEGNTVWYSQGIFCDIGKSKPLETY
jgi:hypothetical protein